MKKLVLATLFALGAAPAFADVSVTDSWVRATVPQQKATGAFMQLKSDVPARLVAASSPLAGVVEIHEMRMEKDVMKMGPVPALELPAGQTVQLAPGGYHVMLMDLKAQVKEGDQVPLTLVVENHDGSRHSVELSVPARPLNALMKMPHGKH
ncbi:copper chaperone PCu(A)C [Thauera aromatica]|uniref:DUF461 protein n=1 Tax=Thauera aromatica K172 TaxID=44139 RepID=A0A2R4BQA8_THAAR|nr:copper chaperone PCu(A)C [Thauera aromatica]AVR89525.1 DUF461 protein [Thauera aromatica K172]